MKFKTTNIAQMASASDVIFDSLHEAITDGHFSEGETLRQDHIARMFNVSRIPVREALTRLEEQGLVTTQRYRGAVVSTLSIEELDEIFEFRALLEPQLISHAVDRMSDKALEQAKRLCNAFATSKDSAKWGKLNRDFHYSLYQAAERPYYLQVVKATLDRIDRYLRAQLVLTDGMATARSEHQAILDACIERDAGKAANLTRLHIVGASRSLVSFLEANRAAAAPAGSPDRG